MNTNKRVASVALLLGLFGSALLGGASAAQASGGYSCANGVSNVVNCNDTILGVPVTLAITGNRTLTGNEITTLENNLNNTAVNAALIEGSTISTFGGFSPTIVVAPSDVNVCISSICT